MLRKCVHILILVASYIFVLYACVIFFQSCHPVELITNTSVQLSANNYVKK
jgi:hypothetical protein